MFLVDTHKEYESVTLPGFEKIMLGHPLQDVDLQALAEEIAKFPSYAGRLQIVESLPVAPAPVVAPVAEPVKVTTVPAETIAPEVEEPRSPKKAK